MKDCIFCKIINREIACNKIYEDEDVISFLDVNPASPGHALVVPKRHYNTILDLPEKELCGVIKAVQKIAKAILKVVDTKSFNLMVNTGRDAGQLVDHVHFHIIPRPKNDKRKFYLSSVKYEQGQKEEILDKIKAILE